jgi:hypothetical protein
MFMSFRAQLKLDDNKHLISESIIEEEDEISVSTRETREGSIDTTILINQELDDEEPLSMEVKQPAIYVVSPLATPAEKVTNQGNKARTPILYTVSLQSYSFFYTQI